MHLRGFIFRLMCTIWQYYFSILLSFVVGYFVLCKFLTSCICSSGWLYVVEMVLKIYAYGFENYWRDGQNRFDFIITLVIGECQPIFNPIIIASFMFFQFVYIFGCMNICMHIISFHLNQRKVNV